MEFNKENRKFITKIPIPLDPLPPVPKHLTIAHIKNLEADRAAKHSKRDPLRTLNSEAGSSQGFIRKKPPTLNAFRHVTLRTKGEETLDWNYQVFRDRDVVDRSISLDEDDRQKKQAHKKARRLSMLPDVAITTVPSVKQTPFQPLCLESNVIKNIKKSLKRPHSRELVGLSPRKAGNGDDGRIAKHQSRVSLFDRLKSPDQCEYLLLFLSKNK